MSKHLKDLNTEQPYLIQWKEFLHSCWFKPLWFLFKQILKLVRFRINFLKLDIRSRTERKTARILKKPDHFWHMVSLNIQMLTMWNILRESNVLSSFNSCYTNVSKKWLLIQKKITFLSNTWFRFILHFFWKLVA